MTPPTTPRWERIVDPPAARGPALMDALLTPHRSLSARAFLLVMCVFSGMNVLVAIFWALQGAWPVLGFLVLDVALLTVAFRMNFRAGRMFERVRIDADVVHIMRQPVRGRASHWVVSDCTLATIARCSSSGGTCTIRCLRTCWLMFG